MFDCLLCLANIYVEGAVGYIKPLPAFPAWAVEKYGPNVRWRYDANETANPMGRVAIGYELDSNKLTLSLEVRHESWIGTSQDHGQNSVWASARVRPFR